MATSAFKSGNGAGISGPFIDSAHAEMKVGAGIAALFFVGLLGWAAMTPLDAGALATGIVAVSGNRQAVQHRDGGIVTAIAIKEGEMVRQGQILVQISASELVAAERGVAGEVYSLLAQKARLRAERDHAASVQAPAEFATLKGDDPALANEALKGQRLLFNARLNLIRTQRGVLGKRLGQHQQEIGGFDHQLRSNREQKRLIGDELDGLRGLVPKGFVSINRLRAIERDAAALDGQYGSYQAYMAKTFEAIGETRLEMVALDQQMMEEVATGLRDVQVRLDELLPRLSATREQIGRSIVRAPASGRVVGLKIFTVGGVVAPGDTLMEIVPQDKALVIEAKAAPTEADDLAVGMKTQVRFTALQERNLPILIGRISKVSADSFEDQRSGTRYFIIEVIVPPGELEKIRAVRKDGGLKAGLPAEVMVPLRKRTALAYLLEPLTQSLWQAGREH